MVAQVAALEPETAANMVQPITLVCNKRPGRPCTQGARPLNMSSESRVRNKISPIQMNRGRAVRVQLDEEPHTVTAMASPAGRDEKIDTASQATPVRVSPTQTPLPRISSRATSSETVMSRSFMAPAYSLRSAWSLCRSVRWPRSSSSSSSRKAIARMTEPAAMANWGIHRGVASLPVDTS